jgi:hypothetical protein
MAEPAPSWTALQQIARRLEHIRLDDGYRTDMGAAVALEPAQYPDEHALGLTLTSLAIVRDEQQPMGRYRVLRALVEATIPVTLADAQARAHAVAADLEEALEAPLPLPGALPLRLEDIVILERPEGLPVIAVQLIVNVRYHRG